MKGKNNITKKEKMKMIGLRYRKFDINDFYFEKINNHNKAYVLGVMYSDGYLVKEGTGTKKIGIDSIDKDWLENIAKDMNFTGEIVELKGKRNGFNSQKTMYRFKISSPKLYDDLIKLGCFEHKTNILKFPTEKQVPIKFLNSFIAGYLDGDGSLSIITEKSGYKRFRMSFTGTHELINGIQKYFNSNLKDIERFPERKKNNTSICYSGILNVYEKISLLYKDTSIRMPRKYKIYLEMSKDSRVK